MLDGTNRDTGQIRKLALAQTDFLPHKFKICFWFRCCIHCNLISELHAGHTSNNNEIAGFKAFSNAGLDKQIEKFSNIIFEIIHLRRVIAAEMDRWRFAWIVIFW